jgi:hypothetical protein
VVPAGAPGHLRGGEVGATPWTYLVQIGRLYERLATGGGIAVYRIAPKEALVEVHGMPIFEVPYFCNAWRGVNQSICELFCSKAYVKLGSEERRATRMTFTLAWAV